MIIQMLPGAENLDGWNTGLLHSVQLGDGQPVINEQVRGKDALQKYSISFRGAFSARIGGAGEPVAIYENRCHLTLTSCHFYRVTFRS